jgi:hypothetical protein
MYICCTVRGYEITYGLKGLVRDGFHERLKCLVCILQFNPYPANVENRVS